MVDLILKTNVEMVDAVELKRHMAGTCFFSVFVHKFSHEQKLCTVILVPIDKNTMINLHHTVLCLGSVVYLRMEYSRKRLLNTKKVI